MAEPCLTYGSMDEMSGRMSEVMLRGDEQHEIASDVFEKKCEVQHLQIPLLMEEIAIASGIMRQASVYHLPTTLTADYILDWIRDKNLTLTQLCEMCVTGCTPLHHLIFDALTPSNLHILIAEGGGFLHCTPRSPKLWNPLGPIEKARAAWMEITENGEVFTLSLLKAEFRAPYAVSEGKGIEIKPIILTITDLPNSPKIQWVMLTCNYLCARKLPSELAAGSPIKESTPHSYPTWGSMHSDIGSLLLHSDVMYPTLSNEDTLYIETNPSMIERNKEFLPSYLSGRNCAAIPYSNTLSGMWDTAIQESRYWPLAAAAAPQDGSPSFFLDQIVYDSSLQKNLYFDEDASRTNTLWHQVDCGQTTQYDELDKCEARETQHTEWSTYYGQPGAQPLAFHDDTHSMHDPIFDPFERTTVSDKLNYENIYDMESIVPMLGESKRTIYEEYPSDTSDAFSYTLCEDVKNIRMYPASSDGFESTVKGPSSSSPHGCVGDALLFDRKSEVSTTFRSTTSFSSTISSVLDETYFVSNSDDGGAGYTDDSMEVSEEEGSYEEGRDREEEEEQQQQRVSSNRIYGKKGAYLDANKWSISIGWVTADKMYKRRLTQSKLCKVGGANEGKGSMALLKSRKLYQQLVRDGEAKPHKWRLLKRSICKKSNEELALKWMEKRNHCMRGACISSTFTDECHDMTRPLLDDDEMNDDSDDVDDDISEFNGDEYPVDGVAVNYNSSPELCSSVFEEGGLKRGVYQTPKEGSHSIATIQKGICECTVQGRMYIRAMWRDPVTRSRCHKYFKQEPHGRDHAIRLAKEYRASRLDSKRRRYDTPAMKLSRVHEATEEQQQQNSPLVLKQDLNELLTSGASDNSIYQHFNRGILHRGSSAVDRYGNRISEEDEEGSLQTMETIPSMTLASRDANCTVATNMNVTMELTAAEQEDPHEYSPSHPSVNTHVDWYPQKQKMANDAFVDDGGLSNSVDTTRINDIQTTYNEGATKNQEVYIQAYTRGIKNHDESAVHTENTATPVCKDTKGCVDTCFSEAETPVNDCNRHASTQNKEGGDNSSRCQDKTVDSSSENNSTTPTRISPPRIYPVIMCTRRYWRVEWIFTETGKRVYKHFGENRYGVEQSKLVAEEFFRNLISRLGNSEGGCSKPQSNSSHNNKKHEKVKSISESVSPVHCSERHKSSRIVSDETEKGMDSLQQPPSAPSPCSDSPISTPCSPKPHKDIYWSPPLAAWVVKWVSGGIPMTQEFSIEAFGVEHAEYVALEFFASLRGDGEEVVGRDAEAYKSGVSTPTKHGRSTTTPKYEHFKKSACTDNTEDYACKTPKKQTPLSVCGWNDARVEGMQDGDMNGVHIGALGWGGGASMPGIHPTKQECDVSQARPGQRVPGRIYMLTIRNVKCWRAEWYDKFNGKRMTRQFAETVHGSECARLKALQVLVNCDCVPDNLLEEARTRFQYEKSSLIVGNGVSGSQKVAGPSPVTTARFDEMGRKVCGSPYRDENVKLEHKEGMVENYMKSSMFGMGRVEDGEVNRRSKAGTRETSRLERYTPQYTAATMMGNMKDDDTLLIGNRNDGCWSDSWYNIEGANEVGRGGIRDAYSAGGVCNTMGLLSNGEFLSYAPLIENEQRGLFNIYSRATPSIFHATSTPTRKIKQATYFSNGYRPSTGVMDPLPLNGDDISKTLDSPNHKVSYQSLCAAHTASAVQSAAAHLYNLSSKSFRD